MLEALCGYYQRAMAQDDPTRVIIPPGYAMAGVSAELVLSPEGELIAVNSLQEPSGKKLVPRQMVVPQPPKRSGQKPEAAFLYETVAFLFGLYKDPAGAAYRFAASREKHEAVLNGCTDAGAQALLRFFAKRTQGSVAYPGIDTELLKKENAFVVFRLQGEANYLHERPALRDAWERYQARATAQQPTIQCLVTGEQAPLALLHGNVAGFGMDKPTLVGFNQDSFCSFGLYGRQGANAPVGQKAAFEYVTALNMLCRDRHHFVNIGKDRVIFWAEREAAEEESLIAFFMGARNDPAEGKTENEEKSKNLDEAQTERIRALLRSVTEGGKAVLEQQTAQMQFYLMGLAANKTRLVVRFFQQSGYGDLVERLAEHYRLMEIVGMRTPYPSPYQLLVEGVLDRKAENIPDSMDAALLRSILSGAPYPPALCQAVLRRIRAEGTVSALRAAILKATINRQEQREVLKVALDRNETDLAYCMGRLFALIENTQYLALGEVNASVADKYLNSALATPQMAFAALLPLNDKHLSKLEKGEPRERAAALVRKKEIAEVMERISLQQGVNGKYAFPDSQDANAQCKFLVGYYHQRQSFFQKKNADAPAETHTDET
jgi:CRISPR-associated protein Csd1